MFDDEDRPTSKVLLTPHDLSDFSVDELDAYISALHDEIKRVEANKQKKQDYAKQLGGFFND